MREIAYVRGDATAPRGRGTRIIAHVCNDRGGWGKGFVLALSRRWPEPEAAYRRWHRERAGNDFGLLADKAAELGASVHMPRIGCGLAGGSWGRVEPLVRKRLVERGTEVTVYDFGA
ncbi:Appr-1-p processing protein [Streptomyces termitum]|uniref:Appr-1-p processing protein n=1 Tax=Streptomyces termitum TaxID=67368 RepID=A0A918W681_9ACTN|nr:Appr-1-p processing protein [Streptomyces termitum]GHA76937.1 Appr-1-p processing protein [Streptomyces termitum]